MNNIIEKTKYKIFNISPKEIKFCIMPSKYCDYTQFGLSKLHPHAGVNRGVFRENTKGYIRINESNWDKKPGALFSKLLEFEALKNHYTGKENWKRSKFALRNAIYIKKDFKVRGFKNYEIFLSKREKQIDDLFESIIKKGIYPINLKKNKKKFIDNISLVLTKDKKFFFNNRGHHRLSIAKIIGLDKIPAKITVAKSNKILENFLSLYK